MVQQSPSGLWTISGPSGAGKTTLLASLLKKLPEAKPLLRVTTREQRPTDVPGEYEYLSKEEFERQGNAGRFLWIAPMHGYYHAAPIDAIDFALSEKHLTIADIAPSMTAILYQHAKDHYKHRLIRSVYLDITDEAEIERRLIERKQGDIERRLRECRNWLEEAKLSPVPFHLIDASTSREEVLRKASDYFTN